MTELQRLQVELEQLNELVAGPQELPPQEWSAEWMIMQSLLTRQSDLLHRQTLLQGFGEVEVTFVGGAEDSNTIELPFLGSFLSEFQDTVAAVVQALKQGSRRTGQFGRDVVFNSLMRLAATPTGSFRLILEGPRDRSTQLALESADPASELPLFDEAVQLVLDVLDAADSDITGTRLRDSVAALGGHRPLSHLANLSRGLGRSGTTATVVHRSPHRQAPRESILSASAAGRLESLLSEQLRPRTESL